MFKLFKYILFFLFLFLVAQCSTEKDKRLNRFYHNTTAYYNGYFNAREIIKVNHKDFLKNIPEDYSELINVNRYPNEEQSKAFFPEMNRAIDKTSTVINKHAMPNEKKGRDAKKEYGKWIDENWLAMGISYFYKREYDEAIEKFEYIIKMYPKDKSKYYAKMWLAKTYIELGNFQKALTYIDEVEVEKEAKELKEAQKEKTKKRRKKYTKKKKKKKKKKRSKVKTTKEREAIKEEKSELVEFPKKMKADFMATKADYYLRNVEYKMALENLDSAIHYEKKKQLRVRYKFIQAQLNQELGNKSKASELYSYVIKKGSSYQMIFYSRINRALLANSKNRTELKDELLKLAKDEKYIEFRDQIYYALADLELQEFNNEQGINYLEQSASYPPSNSKQKAKTFLKLADVYFESKEYVPAQKYYDSTLSELERKNPMYLEIKEKNESLTRLVSYIDNIQLKDSLMKIGELPQKQRRDRAEEIIFANKSKKIDEAKEKEREITNNTDTKTITDPTQKGSFWIYNDKTKASGVKSFQEIWGNVKLEDNWRRSNKSQSGDTETVDLSGAPTVSDEEIDAFLADVPVTKEEMKLSELSIINSNYLSGLIYTNVLKNQKEAIKSFKDNKKRFHPNSKITPSLYQLYKIYQELGQNGDAIAAKNFILENYPESEEAKIILDPNYASNQKKGEGEFAGSYQTAYNLVESQQFQKAVTHIDKVLENKDPNPYECKLLYLKAKACFGLGKEEELDKALQAVVDKCPNTEIGDLAQVALGKLRNQIIKREDENDSKYVKNDNSVHYFAVVVPMTADVNKLKIALSNFNSTSFDSKGLKITTIGLDKNNQTVIVKQFANKDEAHSYMIAFKVNPTMKDFVSKYSYFTITPTNYSTLFSTKDLKKYEEFFNSSYF